MLGMLNTFWGTLSSRAKIVSCITGAIAGIAGTILSVPPAWTALDLPVVATRGWVQRDVHEPTRLAQSQTQRQVLDLQIDVANGKLDQLDNARATLQIEKLKSADDLVKATVDAQIRKIDRDSMAITDQIKSLRTQQR